MDEKTKEIVRQMLVERIAELLYVRFLVDMTDGRKAADMILDMSFKGHGRGDAAAALYKTPEA